MKIIKGGVLVTPDGSFLGDIAVENGKIARVAPGIAPESGDEVIDASRCMVFPGFIDAHTHFDMDNGVTLTADDFASGTAAALAGGTTTIVDFATQDKGGTLRDALDAWHKKAEGKSSCNYAFHMAITDWNERTRAELDEMVRAGVTSFKLYMAYDALRVDDAQILDVLTQMRRIGGVVGVHCENGTLVNALCARERAAGHMGPDAHPRSRPGEVEAEAISRLLYISRLAAHPVNIVHLSSALGLEEVKKARANGQKVFVETCPQYLLLDESNYRREGFEGAKYVCSPPLRAAQDMDALCEAVQTGQIDTIATDHCSFNYDGQKTLGRDDFTKIPNGAPGVEHRPELIYSYFVARERITPGDMCALLSENVAKLFGMYPQKGALRVGSDADIVVWEKGIHSLIHAQTQLQNVDYTPFEGFEITGRPRHVLLGGEIAVRDSQICARGLGRYVKRARSSWL